MDCLLFKTPDTAATAVEIDLVPSGLSIFLGLSLPPPLLLEQPTSAQIAVVNIKVAVFCFYIRFIGFPPSVT